MPDPQESRVPRVQPLDGQFVHLGEIRIPGCRLGHEDRRSARRLPFREHSRPSRRSARSKVPARTGGNLHLHRSHRAANKRGCYRHTVLYGRRGSADRKHHPELPWKRTNSPRMTVGTRRIPDHIAVDQAVIFQVGGRPDMRLYPHRRTVAATTDVRGPLVFEEIRSPSGGRPGQVRGRFARARSRA